MKKALVFVGIFTVMIFAIFLFIITASFQDTALTLEKNVQEALGAMGLKDCHILKFGDMQEIKEIEIDIEVSEEEVSYRIKEILKENAYRQVVDDRNIVKSGDLVLADYVITCNEKQVQDIKDAPIRVGSGNYDKYLEESIVGLETKKKYCIKWNVPEDIENSEWAGEVFEIWITIKDIYSIIEPTLEEYAVDEGYEDSKAYIKFVQKELYQEKKDEIINIYVEKIMDTIIANSEFEIGEEIVAENAMFYYSEHQNIANSYEMELNEYIQEVLEYEGDVYELCCEESLREVQRHLVIGRYAVEKGISVSADDIDYYCVNNNIDLEQISDEHKSYVKYCIIEEKVISEIVDDYIAVKMEAQDEK